MPDTHGLRADVTKRTKRTAKADGQGGWPRRLGGTARRRAALPLHHKGTHQEDIMTQSFVGEWRKELRVLLDYIEAHPSHDLADKRDRVVVLNKLLADADRQAAG